MHHMMAEGINFDIVVGKGNCSRRSISSSKALAAAVAGVVLYITVFRAGGVFSGSMAAFFGENVAQGLGVFIRDRLDLFLLIEIYVCLGSRCTKIGLNVSAILPWAAIAPRVFQVIVSITSTAAGPEIHIVRSNIPVHVSGICFQATISLSSFSTVVVAQIVSCIAVRTIRELIAITYLPYSRCGRSFDIRLCGRIPVDGQLSCFNNNGTVFYGFIGV